MTETPATFTYASVVSRELVHIDLTIASLNGLVILSCDIQNAYLTAYIQEKVWTRDGPDFGYEAGTIMIVKKSLYGPKSSSAELHAHLSETLNDIGFLYTKAENVVWFRPAVKPNCFEYYE